MWFYFEIIYHRQFDVENDKGVGLTIFAHLGDQTSRNGFVF